jgi:VWFA-related protein
MKARLVWMAVVLCGLALAQRSVVAQADYPVTLDVVVTDKMDRPVVDLKPEEFKVLDNKEMRSITSVRMVNGEGDKPDPPVTAYLLVDMINTPIETLSIELKSIQSYLAQAGPRLPLPTALVFLSETDLKWQSEPTRDPKVLLANLASNEVLRRSFQNQGGYQQLVQMRQKSLEALNGVTLKLNNVEGRKLVVWLSPGWAAFEHQTSQKSPAEFQALFDYIVGISSALRQAGVTIYSVNPVGAARDLGSSNESYYKEFVKGVSSPKQTDNGDLGLQVIAAQTGGNVLYGSNNIGKMIDQCLSDAQVFYEVTYSAAHARQGNEFHAVQVTVDKPGLKSRTRYGYYAQP